MPVLAAVRQREARRIPEAIGRPVHDLRHNRERAHRARTDARRQQQVRKVDGTALSRSGERGMQPSRENIAQSHVVN
jgi:hypothetical protein